MKSRKIDEFSQRKRCKLLADARPTAIEVKAEIDESTGHSPMGYGVVEFIVLETAGLCLRAPFVADDFVAAGNLHSCFGTGDGMTTKSAVIGAVGDVVGSGVDRIGSCNGPSRGAGATSSAPRTERQNECQCSEI